jgi:type I restriction enzyme S subunit
MTNLSGTNLNSRSAAGPGRGEDKESPSSLPRYAEYKDSGVASLGLVPSHWQIKRLRFVAEFNPSKSEVARLDRQMDVSFLPMDAIGDDGTIRLDETRTLAQVENGYTYFRDGDVVIAKITPCFENGKGAFVRGLLNGVGFGTTELIVVRPKPKATSSDYLEWLFVSPTFRKDAEGAMYGAGGQKRVPDSFVRDYLDAVPPIEEQSAIATFLNRETGKIDALIAEQEKLLTLLAEKRQATISHAVTRGLNPNAPMKDSGVPWLGDVPAHWEVVPLKHLCSLLKDGTHLPPLRVEDGVPLLSVRNIDESVFAFREDDSMISTDDYVELCRAFVPQAGDVLMASVGATLGKVAVVPEVMSHFHIQRSLAIFRTISSVSGSWLFYCISSGAFQSLLWANIGFSAQPGIYLGTLKDFQIPVPPVEEQKAIVSMMASEIGRLDALKSDAEHAISLLKERRGALIAAAVTGKIDVRQAA